MLRRLLGPALLLGLALVPSASAHPVEIVFGEQCPEPAIADVHAWPDDWIDGGIVDPNPAYVDPTTPGWKPDDIGHAINKAGRIFVCPGNFPPDLEHLDVPVP